MNLRSEQSRLAFSTASIVGGVVLVVGTQMFPHLLTWIWSAALMAALVAFMFVQYFGKV